MKKHLALIPVVALLVAASAFAAWTPAPASDDGNTPVAASGLSCPHGGEGGCGCTGNGECGCGGGCNCGGEGGCGCGAECNCGGEGNAQCPNFVDENGDTVCDNRGQGNCGCHGGGQ